MRIEGLSQLQRMITSERKASISNVVCMYFASACFFQLTMVAIVVDVNSCSISHIDFAE